LKLFTSDKGGEIGMNKYGKKKRHLIVLNVYTYFLFRW
jgi:hypothetical protein